MTKISLICCYGIYSKKTRNELQISGLDEYIEQIVHFFKENDDFSDIILCGGYTEKTENISESESMRQILEKKFEENNIKINLKVENTSFKTYENMVFGTLSVRNKNIQKILFISDSNRKNKVEIEAKILFEGIDIKLSFMNFTRKDDHKASDEKIQTLEALPYELNSKTFQTLKTYFQEVMKKVM